MKSAEEKLRLEEEKEQQRREEKMKLDEERDQLRKLSEQANELGAKASEGTVFEEEEEETSNRHPTVFMDEPEEKTEVKKESLPEWETKIDKEKVVFNGLGWLKSVCIGILIGVILVVFVIQRNNVYGSSMEPTLYEGDIIFTQKLDNYFDTYERGDIVILDGTDMEGYTHDEYLIKRVIGLPGETVKIENGKVFIKKGDGLEFEELDEPYLLSGTITTVTGTGLAKGYDEITLSSTEYYCLGDNRFVSKDSRNLGPFDADRIKGVALVRVYPFDSIKFVK